ncbi:MAG: 4Fe-4S binding protein [Candidatus Sumerlaeia bacterium]
MASRRAPLQYRLFVAFRRGSQAVFFTLFVWAALGTRLDAGAFSLEPRLDSNVRWFFHFDPLILLSTVLAHRRLEWVLSWALVVAGATVLLGRVFCGWVCPFGTLHHAAGWVGRRVWREKWRRPVLEKYHPAQRVRVWLLAGLLAAAVFGVNLAGWLDPLSFLQRSLTVFVFPLAERVLLGLAAVLKGAGGGPVEGAGRALESWTLEQAFGFSPFTYRQAALIGGLFIGILTVNIFIRRFWCRFVCPLGALLGVLSRWSLLRIQPGQSCTDCRVCAADCEGGADPYRPQGPRQSECLLVGNCLVQCHRSELRFELGRSGGGVRGVDIPDPGRRRLLGAALAGLAAAPLVRIGLRPDRPHPALIRPPGALAEAEFLAACVRCDACLKACPTNFLQPAFLEGRLEGLWTPIGDAGFGWCEQDCTLCGQACPTGAIRLLSLAEKRAAKIATAFVDRSRCLPWVFERECAVCEEHCPTTPKAITFLDGGGRGWRGGQGAGRRAGQGRDLEADQGQSRGAQGEEPPVPYGIPEDETDSREPGRRFKRPIVDPEVCTGCGICQFKCPVTDLPAIRITAVGEKRAATNPFG